VASLDAPVALLIFKRPEATAQAIERILAAGPKQLLVVADGPRPGAPGERELCERARAAIDGERLVCEVRTQFADANLGLRRRMSSGMDWVFEQCDKAILVEDDCLPEPTFFPFCDELLHRYADEPRIMMVSGDNFLPARHTQKHSYYFSRYAHIWGWATWRRAWRLYDVAMADWPARRDSGWLREKFDSEAEARHWGSIFDKVHDGRISTWDYQWQYACFAHDCLAAVPERHLVTNIGLGGAATNTANPDDPHFRARPAALPLPLRHPLAVKRSEKADRKEFQTLFGKPGRLSKFLRRLRKRLAGAAGRRSSPPG
jgi:hypothetical protein